MVPLESTIPGAFLDKCGEINLPYISSIYFIDVNGIAIGKCIDKLRTAIGNRNYPVYLLTTVICVAPVFLNVKVAVWFVSDFWNSAAWRKYRNSSHSTSPSHRSQRMSWRNHRRISIRRG